ncbi:MAG TPA: hypothetical protein VFT64_01240 [Rickettsiales bacterium]|nr:hypothetical protein [Rickettsiales bacterium]
MFSLRTLLAAILTIAIAVAGVPVYAGSSCAMKSGAHQMMKDCPDCADHADSKGENKECGKTDCAVNCSSAVSLSASPAIASVFLPVVYTVAAFHPADDMVISFFSQTQERPPKHLA